MDDLSYKSINTSRTRRPMMIKGLTPQLPERGRIKIGFKGEMRKSGRGTDFQPPQKLDHFVVTTLQRGEDGNFIPDETLMARLGDKPTEIPVRLLYDDPALNFPTRYACFVGRSLWCSGDGETAIRAPATPTGPPQEVACTCERADPAYKGNDKCKMNGSLSVLIEGAGGIGGVWKFRTTSYNSIVGIMSTLAFIRQMTGGVLANIPLKLKVQPKQAAAPDGNPVTIYVVSLEFDGDMPGLQEIAHGIALGRAKMNISIEHIEDEARRMLALAAPAHVPLAGDDANDVIEEFYPEQATAEPEPPRGRDIKPKALGEAFDPETGELLDAAQIERDARAAASGGTESLRGYLRQISSESRSILNGRVGTKDNPGELLTLAMTVDQASRDQHPDSLPGTTPETPQPTEQATAAAPNARQPGGEPVMADMLGGEARQTKSLRFNLPRNPSERTWQEFSDFVDVTLADGEPGRAIRGENQHALDILKKADVDLYDAIQGRLGK